MRILIPIVVLVAILQAVPARAQLGGRPSEEEIGEINVYLTPAEAIREIFDHVARVDTSVAVLTREEREIIRKELGISPGADTLLVFCPRSAEGDTLGWAVIDNEVGKYRPITFMVGTRPDRSIAGVEVLVYRESRGGEVRRARFLRQYRGKDVDDPIRLNRDILNVAGATMSVNALNHGIKRVLLTLDLLSRRNQP